MEQKAKCAGPVFIFLFFVDLCCHGKRKALLLSTYNAIALDFSAVSFSSCTSTCALPVFPCKDFNSFGQTTRVVYRAARKRVFCQAPILQGVPFKKMSEVPQGSP